MREGRVEGNQISPTVVFVESEVAVRRRGQGRGQDKLQ